jgi:DNA-binding NarL/FixJ family response regulator
MDTAASRAAVGTQPHQRPVLTVLEPSAAGSDRPGSHADATGEPAIRVVIADDSYIIRQGLSRLLGVGDGVEVVATCSEHQSLLRAIEAENPDVVVTDIRMPPSSTEEGLRLVDALRRTHPEMGVVVLSQVVEPSHAFALLEGGSDGRAYLLKERIQRRGQLISAIEAVARGGSMIDAKVMEGLVTTRRDAEPSPLAELTPREREILACVARGHSNQAIADELVLTKRAVEKHINAIFLTLGLTWATDVSRRVKAALMYLAESDEG